LDSSSQTREEKVSDVNERLQGCHLIG